MNVTKSNFSAILPSVKESIEECDFLAIDTELTGLHSSQASEHAFDTMEERYVKLKEQCSKFLIIQFGVSTFKYHPKQNKYTHRDFNFYVFPRTDIRQTPDPRFLCQASSLHFLASHGFDFNKAIYEGIPYLTLAQEEKIKSYLTNKYNIERDTLNSANRNSSVNGQKVVDIPNEHKEFIAEIQQQVDSFMSNESETVIELKPCSAYRRKLIYETIQQKHQTGIEMSSNVNEEKERFITIVKCTPQDKLDKLQSREINDLDDVENCVGFRRVMEYISDSKKLVIGHHMYLDILHAIEQFFSPVPEDLKEFKSMCRVIFPYLMDTKCLSKSDKLKGFIECTYLSNLCKQVCGKAFHLPKIEPEDGFKGYSLESEQLHEAGYDAFVTGVCFIGMSKKLGALHPQSSDHVNPKSKVLSPYMNRFYIMKHFDIAYLNLSGPDPEPKRDNVFHVSFPQEWKTVDLVELFLPYGEIYVNWLDDNSALVALKNVENSLKAKTALVNKFSKLYHVRPYSTYQTWANQQLVLEKDEIKKAHVPSANKSLGSKRSSSGSAEGSCSMDLIPEGDENEAETADSSDILPPSKKLKSIEEENETGSSSSPALLFEEENTW